MPTDADEVLTASELAQRLQVKAATVLQWHRSGKIPVIRITPKILRFNYADVLAALRTSADGKGGAV